MQALQAEFPERREKLLHLLRIDLDWRMHLVFTFCPSIKHFLAVNFTVLGLAFIPYVLVIFSNVC